MLREEDNRYCVDCDAKSQWISLIDEILSWKAFRIASLGPRWASWNIGVFICIRCAGFHRNLGVHISKVKSVNLDSWTGGQIAVSHWSNLLSSRSSSSLDFQSMQAMGNSRARAVYEANLPDGFRRPQADTYENEFDHDFNRFRRLWSRALEAFIRAKYEQRKWIAKEWIPPEMTVGILCRWISEDVDERLQMIEAESNQWQNDNQSEVVEQVRRRSNENVIMREIDSSHQRKNPSLNLYQCRFRLRSRHPYPMALSLLKIFWISVISINTESMINELIHSRWAIGSSSQRSIKAIRCFRSFAWIIFRINSI